MGSLNDHVTQNIADAGTLQDKLIAFFGSIHRGPGSPEGSVTAPVGSWYWDSDTGDLYRKASGSGNTGWEGAAGSALSGTFDATEELWLPAEAASAWLGSASFQSFGKVGHWNLDAATAETVGVSAVAWPSHWASFDAYALFSQPGTGTGDMRLNMEVYEFDAGESYGAISGLLHQMEQTVSMSGVDGEIQQALMGSAKSIPTKLLSTLKVTREAADAADTFASDVRFHGVKLVKAS